MGGFMALIVFLIGILVGLLLNDCIYKMSRKENLFNAYFQCNNWKMNLNWQNIRSIYLVVILLSGILFVLLFDRFKLNIDFFIYGFVLSLLIIVAFVDMKIKIIPDIIVLLILLGAIVHELLKLIIHKSFVNLLDNIIGLAVGGILFILIFAFSKGGIGGGDIKLISVLGFVLGIPKIFLCIFLSFLFGAIASIVLLALGLKGKKDSIPFGPFIVLSFIITFFWGEEIIYWYIVNMFT